MLCVDDLVKLNAFQTLSEARLQWLCDRAQELNLSRGEIIEEEGSALQGFFNSNIRAGWKSPLVERIILCELT